MPIVEKELSDLRHHIRGQLSDHGIPRPLHASVIDYIMDGIRPGAFVAAVIQNSLVMSYLRADEENCTKLNSWARFLHWEMPIGSWGSPQMYELWCKNGGISGMARESETEGVIDIARRTSTAGSNETRDDVPSEGAEVDGLF